MSQPEIFRRCSWCGASFKAGALFCPQCGKAITPRVARHDSQVAPEATAEDFKETVATGVRGDGDVSDGLKRQATPSPRLEASGPDLKPENAQQAAIETAERNHAAAGEVLRQSSDVGAVTSRPDHNFRAGVEAIEPIGTTARGALEDKARLRIDKLRRASSVVFKEATYDPSVRFILVVILLFGLFLLLLLFNKWLG